MTVPLYTYQCKACSRKQPIFKKIADLDEPEYCSVCEHKAMQRLIEAPAVRGDYAGYECPVSGIWIEGKRAHEENLKKHGCRVLESGETQQAAAFRAQQQEQFEESIASTAEQIVETLPARKREQLAAELEAGLDVSFERQSA
jgi:putative FmdB family regulatory protein